MRKRKLCIGRRMQYVRVICAALAPGATAVQTQTAVPAKPDAN